MKHLKSFKLFETESAIPKLKRLLELGMISDKEYFDGVIENSSEEYSYASIECELDLYWILQETPEGTKTSAKVHLRENNLKQSNILVDLSTISVDYWTEEDAEYIRTLDTPGSDLLLRFEIAYSTDRDAVEDWADELIGRLAHDIDINFR